jgi:hypothetical protein
MSAIEANVLEPTSLLSNSPLRYSRFATLSLLHKVDTREGMAPANYPLGHVTIATKLLLVAISL